MYNLLSKFAAVFICFTLAACSGGSDSKDAVAAPQTPDSGSEAGVITEPPPASSPSIPPTPVVVPPDSPPPQDPSPPDTEFPQGDDLLITEVSANANVSGNESTPWFEIYNPTSSGIQLADYVLRSSWRHQRGFEHIHDAGQSMSPPAEFTFPSAVIPPGGYMVVAAKRKDYFADTSQVVHVALHDRYPSWDGEGWIELVRGGQTVDFIRLRGLRDTSAMPLTPGHWSGPSFDNYSESSIFVDVSGSYVRLAANNMQDTNTHTDWSFVHFATPGGRNDVAPGVSDEDEDGIPDSAEVEGGTYAGMDLFAMGARTGRRDIFVEFDYMITAHPEFTVSSQPQERSLQKVVEAFARKNVVVHFDVGSAYSSEFNPEKFNLGRGNPVAHASCILMERYMERAEVSGCTSLYEYKTRYMDVRRRYLFHYGVFAVSIDNMSLAQAELFGNDMVYALDGWTDGSNLTESDFNRLINIQASVIMHELGHNLGLHHGGNESVPYKPNHYSVMNYLYAFLGLSASPQSATASDRYRHLETGRGAPTDVCRLDNSPCSDSFYIDYSDGSSEDIDENHVLESRNIGRGSIAGAYADWNGNGMLDSDPYEYYFNGSLLKRLPYPGRILKDYNEWDNLVSVGGMAGRMKAWDMSWDGYSGATSFFSHVGLNE
jgi:hypothetical protein